MNLTRVGLGTWAIGGDWFFGWGPQDDADSIDAIGEALDCGVNWIDTAAAYGFGRSEEVVGRALRKLGKSAIVATKCGIVRGNNNQPVRWLKRESVYKEADDSLRRLGVDVIDLYQIHWPEPQKDIEEAYESLLELKERGKVRWVGVCNFSCEQLELVSRIAPVSSLQPPYSLLSRGIEQETLPWCSENSVGVICYSPMECGLLTGKLSKEWAEGLSPTDWRMAHRKRFKHNYYEEPERSGLIRWVERLSSIAARSNHTVAQLAVSWVLRRKEVNAAIVGARRKGQIKETAEAGNWTLSDDELGEIDDSYREYQRQMGREVE